MKAKTSISQFEKEGSMFGLGAGELLLICGIAFLFFGPKKIPELAKGLGQGIREFQKARQGQDENANDKKEA